MDVKHNISTFTKFVLTLRLILHFTKPQVINLLIMLIQAHIAYIDLENKYFNFAIKLINKNFGYKNSFDSVILTLSLRSN